MFHFWFVSWVGDENWRNGTALSYHYWTTPLPNWTGWYLSAYLPKIVHVMSVAMHFVIELLVVVLLLFPPTRAIGFWGVFILQVIGFVVTEYIRANWLVRHHCYWKLWIVQLLLCRCCTMRPRWFDVSNILSGLVLRYCHSFTILAPVSWLWGTLVYCSLESSWVACFWCIIESQFVEYLLRHVPLPPGNELELIIAHLYCDCARLLVYQFVIPTTLPILQRYA